MYTRLPSECCDVCVGHTMSTLNLIYLDFQWFSLFDPRNYSEHFLGGQWELALELKQDMTRPATFKRRKQSQGVGTIIYANSQYEHNRFIRYKHPFAHLHLIRFMYIYIYYIDCMTTIRAIKNNLVTYAHIAAWRSNLGGSLSHLQWPGLPLWAPQLGNGKCHCQCWRNCNRRNETSTRNRPWKHMKTYKTFWFKTI